MVDMEAIFKRPPIPPIKAEIKEKCSEGKIKVKFGGILNLKFKKSNTNTRFQYLRQNPNNNSSCLIVITRRSSQSTS